jgi:hypothetical protein
MHDSASSTLASLTMADIHALRLSGQDRSKRTAVALRNSFHITPPLLAKISQIGGESDAVDTY